MINNKMKAILFSLLMIVPSTIVYSTINDKFNETYVLGDVFEPMDTNISLIPTDDAAIHRSTTSAYGYLITRNNYGAGGGSGWAYDSVLKFNVSAFKNTTKVTSAILRLYYFQSWDTDPSGRNITFTRLLGDWNESTINWTNAPANDTIASGIGVIPALENWISVNVTADVQAFINGSKANYGWRMIDAEYWGKVNIPIARYCSKDYVGSGGDLTLRPYLQIQSDQNISAPIIVTNDVTNITERNATFNVFVQSDGGEPCNVWFQWGNTTNYEGYLGTSLHTPNLTVSVGNNVTYISYKINKTNTSSWIKRPNANGTYSQLTPYGDSPNYKCVDETTSDDNTTYVVGSGGQKDYYNIDGIDGPIDAIYNVTVYARVWNGHTEMPWEAIEIGTSGTKGTGSVIKSLTLSGSWPNRIAQWFDISQTFTKIPDGYGYSTYYFTKPDIEETQLVLLSVGSDALNTTQVYCNITGSTPDFTPGQLYHMRAVANNSNSTVYGNDTAFLTKPFCSTNLTVRPSGNGQLNVTWVKGEGANNTYVERNATAASNWTRGQGVLVYNGTGTSFVDTTLLNNVTYKYQAWSYAQWTYNPTLYQFSDGNATGYNTTFNGTTQPNVTTNNATNVNATSATLNGYLIDDGGENCSVWFEFGNTTTYGQLTGYQLKNTGQEFNYTILSNYSLGTTKLILRPIANGTLTQFPKECNETDGNLTNNSHWAQVDDVISDANATYLLQSTGGIKTVDFFRIANLTNMTGVIYRINVSINTQSDTGSTSTAFQCINVSGTEYDGAANSCPWNWQNQTFNQFWSKNPKTGSSWTWADLNNLQIGVGTNFTSNPVRVTQVFVTIEYNNTMLYPGRIYHYRAAANNSNVTAYGNDSMFLTKPNATTNLTARTFEKNQINLTWIKGDGANRTYVERNTIGNWTFGSGTIIYNGSNTSFNDNSLIVGKTYYYQAWSYTEWNESGTWYKYSNDYAIAFNTTEGYAAPNVTTNDSIGVEETNATINGFLVSDGGENCTVGFQYGLTTAYENNVTVLPTYIYAGGESISNFTQYWPSNMTVKVNASYPGAIYAIAEDYDYIYIGGTTQSVYQYYKSNMTFKTNTTTAYGGSIKSLGIDSEYLYVGGEIGSVPHSASNIKQYWKNNMTFKANTTAHGGGVESIAEDEEYVYAAGESSATQQYWKSNLTEKASANFGGPQVEAITVDDTYLYVAGMSSLNHVKQFWKQNMTLKLNSTSVGFPYAITQDDTYIYCGGYDEVIYQLWKSNMTIKASVGHGRFINAMAQDSTYVYAGGGGGGQAQFTKLKQYWKSNMTLNAESIPYGDEIQAISLSPDPYETGQTFSFNATGLTPGTLYHYRAYANNSNSTVNGTDKAFLTKPIGPSNLNVTVYGKNAFDLSWIKGAGANNTYIERNTTNNWSRGQGDVIYNDVGTSFTDSGLMRNTTYYYRAWSYTEWNYNSSLYQFSDGNATGYNMTYNGTIPIVTTNASTNINVTSATLNGYLNDDGGENCSAWFEYGLTTGYGTNVSIPGPSTYIYIAGATTQKVQQYWQSNLTKKAETANYSGTINAIAEDDDYVYAGGATNQTVWQIWKSNMTKKSNTSNYGSTILAIAVDGTYLYVGGTTIGQIYQYWKSNMTFKANLSHQYEGYNATVRAISQDASYIYVAGFSGTVYQIWKSNMTKKAETEEIGDEMYAIAVDDDYIYIGLGTRNRIYQYYKSNMTFKANTSEYGTTIYAVAEDTNYVYGAGGAGMGNARRVVKYLKSDLSFVARTDYLNNFYAIADDENYTYSVGAGQVIYQHFKSNMTLNATSTYYGGTIYAISLLPTYETYVAGDTFSADVSGLSPGTMYHFRAAANNTNGTAYGNDSIFLTKPNAITTLVAKTFGTNQMNLTWAKGSEANYTYIERNTTGNWTRGSGTFVYNGSSTSFNDTGLLKKTKYYYQAWSYTEWNGSGMWYQYSYDYALAFNTTLDIYAPNITTNESTSVEETNATLNGFLGYDGGENCSTWFEYGLTTGYGSKTSNQTKSANTTFSASLNNLTNGTLYHFKAAANNSNSTIYGSDKIFLTKPLGPSNLNATKYSTNQINLTWTIGNGADRTYIEWNTSASWTRGQGNLVCNVTTNHYEHAGLTNGTRYYYQAWSYANESVLYQFSDNFTSANNRILCLLNILNESPQNQSTSIALNISELNVTINNPDGQPFNWTIQTSPYIGNSSGTNQGNGSKICNISNVLPGTTYKWYVNTTDDLDYTNASFTFTITYAPTISEEFPGNGSTSEKRPDCHVKISDQDDSMLTISIYENTTGSWVLQQTNVTYLFIGEYDIVYWNYANASAYGYTYWWKVNLSDDKGAYTEKIYSFIIANIKPIQSMESPTNGSINIRTNITNISVYIEDYEGEPLTWSIQTSPNMGTASGYGQANGTKICSVSGLIIETTYTWFVNSTDGADWTNKTYSFTTSKRPAILNPNPLNGSASETTPICNVTISDTDGGNVTTSFYENTTGSWVLQKTIVTYITNRTNVIWNYFQNASVANKDYWWKVIATDDTGLANETIFNFKTNHAPAFSGMNPAPGMTNVAPNITSINLTMSDPAGNLMNWTIQTSPYIGNSSGINGVNGSKVCAVSNLTPGVTYTWYVNATDGADWTRKSYTFTTSAIPAITYAVPYGNSMPRPTCIVVVADSEYGNITIRFYENTTGSWTLQQTNITTLPLSDTVYWIFNNASNYETDYWWKVNITDETNLSNESILNFKTYPNYPPAVLGEDPTNNSIDISASITTLSVQITDPEGDHMNFTIETNPYIGVSSGNNITNGILYCPVSGLTTYTNYTWYVNATDGINWTRAVFTFKTRPNNNTMLSNPIPANGSINMALDISLLSARIEDPEGDPLSWTIETSPNIGATSGTVELNGTKSCNVSGLQSDTTYYWYVNVTDGQQWNKEIYHFTTSHRPLITNFYPANGSSGCDVSPICHVAVNDVDGVGDEILVYWFENTTGDWVLRQTSHNITSLPMTLYWNYTQATGYSQWYYWKVNATDNKGAYSESILKFMPKPNQPPTLSSPSPTNNSVNVLTSTSQLSITIYDNESDRINWTIETNPYMGNSSGQNESNGAKICSISGLQAGMIYTWFVNATDGNSWRNATYLFTTTYNPNMNSPNPSDGGWTAIKPICNVTVSDPDGGQVNVSFYENTSGSWELKHYTMVMVNTPQNIIWDKYDNASTYSKEYWWRVNVSDNRGGSMENIYSFFTDTPTVVDSPNPSNGSTNNDKAMAQLSINMQDAEGDNLTWTIQTSPNIGSSSGTSEGNGTKICSIINLVSGDLYTWYVNVSDGYYSIKNYYVFRVSYVPEITYPDPSNGSTIPFNPICNVTVFDQDGDLVEVRFYENSSGSWILQQTNSSVDASLPTNVIWSSYVNANQYSKMYWWKVQSTDRKNCTTEAIYDFTTVSNNPPSFTSIEPENNSVNIQLYLSALNITINDYEGSPLTWTIQTLPNVGNANGINESNGTKSCSLSGLQTGITYTWIVNATDGFNWSNATYYFTTRHSQQITNPGPTNGQTNVSLKPVCNVTVFNIDDQTVDVNIYENSTGTWVLRQTNASVNVTTPQNIIWDNFDTATRYSKTYWWRVNVSDVKGSSLEVIYHFTTVPNTPPDITAEDPANQSVWILRNLTRVSVTITDYEGHPFNWTIHGNYIIANASNGASNGTYYADINATMPYNYQIFWYVNVTDGLDWRNKTYYFTTEHDIENPVINSVSIDPPISKRDRLVTITANITDNDRINRTFIIFPTLNWTYQMYMSAPNIFTYPSNYSILGNYVFYIATYDYADNAAFSSYYNFTIVTKELTITLYVLEYVNKLANNSLLVKITNSYTGRQMGNLSGNITFYLKDPNGTMILNATNPLEIAPGLYEQEFTIMGNLGTYLAWVLIDYNGSIYMDANVFEVRYDTYENVTELTSRMGDFIQLQQVDRWNSTQEIISHINLVSKGVGETQQKTKQAGITSELQASALGTLFQYLFTLLFTLGLFLASSFLYGRRKASKIAKKAANLPSTVVKRIRD